MGLKALVIRWVEEWAERELDARVDARLRAWAGAELKEQVGAYFDAEFRDRFDALPKADLKELLDTYFDARADDFIGEKFDTRFFTWADCWADKNLRPRLDEHFDKWLSERLDRLVQARVANRIDDRIDRRIKQFLLAFRTQITEGMARAADNPQPAVPESAESSRSAAPEPSEKLVTASELVKLLKQREIGVHRVRSLLKGHEVSSERPKKYRLGDAAARILLRNGEKVLRESKRKHS